jgi:hypothetical protein
MTVRELINELIDCDPESDVYIADGDSELHELGLVFSGGEDVIIEMAGIADDDD